MPENEIETAAGHQPGDIRSVTEIVQDIVEKAQDIIRSEVQLARAEVREEAAKAVRASVLGAAGGLLGLYALGFLLLAAIYGLSMFLPPWLAAAIVAVTTGAVAGGLIMTGRKRWRSVHAAPKTVETIREDIEWVKDRTKSSSI